MCLANELEDHLDLGVLYCANVESRLRYIKSNGETMIKMLNDLGFPQLSSELERILQETYSAKILPGLQNHYNSSLTEVERQTRNKKNGGKRKLLRVLRVLLQKASLDR